MKRRQFNRYSWTSWWRVLNEVQCNEKRKILSLSDVVREVYHSSKILDQNYLKQSFPLPVLLLCHSKSLTSSPLKPGPPWTPSSPLFPIGPGSPGGPLEPLSPWYPCGPFLPRWPVGPGFPGGPGMPGGPPTPLDPWGGRVNNNKLKCNDFNWDHLTVFYQSQHE